jgi:hypothetical protein
MSSFHTLKRNTDRPPQCKADSQIILGNDTALLQQMPEPELSIVRRDKIAQPVSGVIRLQSCYIAV